MVVINSLPMCSSRRCLMFAYRSVVRTTKCTAAALLPRRSHHVVRECGKTAVYSKLLPAENAKLRPSSASYSNGSSKFQSSKFDAKSTSKMNSEKSDAYDLAMLKLMEKTFVRATTQLADKQPDEAVATLKAGYTACIELMASSGNEPTEASTHEAETIVTALFREKVRRIYDTQLMMMTLSGMLFLWSAGLGVASAVNASHLFDDLPFAFREITTFASVLIAAFATVRFFRFVRVFSYFRVLVSGQAKKCLQEAEQMTTQKNDQKK